MQPFDRAKEAAVVVGGSTGCGDQSAGEQQALELADGCNAGRGRDEVRNKAPGLCFGRKAAKAHSTPMSLVETGQDGISGFRRDHGFFWWRLRGGEEEEMEWNGESGGHAQQPGQVRVVGSFDTEAS